MTHRNSSTRSSPSSPPWYEDCHYYHDILGLRVVSDYDNAEPFVAMYRISIEIVVVQAKFGEILPNHALGAGYDAYLEPDTIEGIDEFYREWRKKAPRLPSHPVMTPYGSYEFVIEDIDGRLIGVGRIKGKKICVF